MLSKEQHGYRVQKEAKKFTDYQVSSHRWIPGMTFHRSQCTSFADKYKPLEHQVHNQYSAQTCIRKFLKFDGTLVYHYLSDTLKLVL